MDKHTGKSESTVVRPHEKMHIIDERVERAFYSMPYVEAMMAELNEKDPNTRVHVVRVAEVLREVAQSRDFLDERMIAFLRGALVHDMGKVEVEDELLIGGRVFAPGERPEGFKAHPDIGYARLFGFDPRSANYALYHHARQKFPYPPGLSIDDIRDKELQEEVELLSICDKVEACRTPRTYRPWPLPDEGILEEVLGGFKPERHEEARVLTNQMISIHKRLYPHPERGVIL